MIRKIMGERADAFAELVEVRRRLGLSDSFGLQIEKRFFQFIRRNHATLAIEPGLGCYPMCFTTASPNSEHLTSFAPSIMRAKS